ncbi:MAG: phosphoglucosamine mutase [Bacteroides sp.]|jgi:phosphomannomutase|nr:phosphoglucosamine mutase [Bacteroides sp.]
MTLIQSISGIRGTIGGKPGEGFSPVDVLKFSGAFGMWLKSRFPEERLRVVVGRDARISGPVVNKIVTSVLQSMGIDIVDGGISTTPTIAMAVGFFQANAGIIITASHNPKNWNALKLLNEHGEFLTAEQGEEMNRFLDWNAFDFVPIEKFGHYSKEDGMIEMHIEKILSLPIVDVEAIREANFRIVVDGVNSSGGLAVPLLLEALGVKTIHEIYCEPNGIFPHNPEPLPENLIELSAEVVNKNAHLGIAVDPDVDRLALVCEDEEMFGEEYTLVAVADYVLSQTPGNTVSNLSSTQALAEVTREHGQEYFSSAVGEVNVVEAMKKHHAVIGGEGNGGVIYPALHYGRDALVGIALYLSLLARSGKTCTVLKKKYPEYYISKNKIELPAEVNLDMIFNKIIEKYAKHPIDQTDGAKILFDKEWVHLRRSNTEPIIRIYCESDSLVKAEHLGKKVIMDISELLKGEED